MPTVFLSYRKSDTRKDAGRLSDSIRKQAGKRWAFRDVVDISPGAQFDEVLRRELGRARVTLVLIGPMWLQDLRRRMSADATDYVRVEVATALASDKRVVPVLLDGARLPPAEELPEDLAPLAMRQAIALRDESWDDDVDRLLDAIGRPYGWWSLVARAVIIPVVITFLVQLLAPTLNAEEALAYVLWIVGIYVLAEIVLVYRWWRRREGQMTRRKPRKPVASILFTLISVHAAACTEPPPHEAGLFRRKGDGRPSSVLTIDRIKCIRTEDWIGRDHVQVLCIADSQLLDSKRRAMNDGDVWSLGVSIPFGEQAVVRLIEEDDLDPDDHMGSLVVYPDPTVTRGTAHIAHYTARYAIDYRLVSRTRDSRRTRAKAAIDAFAKNRSGGRFAKLRRDEIAEELRARVDEPTLMRQGQAPLCGPMLVLVAMAQHEPDRYVRFAIEMFEQGQYTGDGLLIRPDSHLLTDDPPQGIAQVDWMLGASMRDSMNAWIDFEGERQEGALARFFRNATNQLAAISTPSDIKAWFEGLLSCKTVTVRITVVSGEVDAYREVLAAANTGNVGALFVDHHKIPGVTGGTLNVPDHWVLAQSAAAARSRLVDRFRPDSDYVFSWGLLCPIPRDWSDQAIQDLVFATVVAYY